VCALDDHGHPHFEWLINRERQRGKLVYYVFDLLRLGDKDLRAEPLYGRKKLLQKLLKKNDTLRYVDHVENDGLHLSAGALALGLEGIIAKDKNSPYIEGPSETWHWQKNQKRNTSGKKRSNSDNDRRLLRPFFRDIAAKRFLPLP
jgi:bifunctional non-homologous end joining protein LigD